MLQSAFGQAVFSNAATLSVKYVPMLGDINDDGIVDSADLSLLLIDYGQTGESLPTDLNGDGMVDSGDLNLLLLYYGKSRLSR